MARPTKAQAIQKKAREELLSAIGSMGKEAREGNVQAFQALAKAGSVGDSGGIKINNVVGVDARNHGNNEADWKFFQKFRGRLDQTLLRGALPDADEGSDDQNPRPKEVAATTPEGVSGES